MGFFDKIKDGLSKTKKNVTNQLTGMIASFTAGWVVYSCGDVRSAFVVSTVLVILLIPITVWIVKKAMSQPFYVAHSPFGRRMNEAEPKTR